jgi:hypothetical protein
MDMKEGFAGFPGIAVFVEILGHAVMAPPFTEENFTLPTLYRSDALQPGKAHDFSRFSRR